MAQSDLQGAGSGALAGGLGGAGTGAGVGFAFGGPPGALIGAGIGFGVGVIGGAITGAMDAADQRELEREIQYHQDMLDKAQRRFEANSVIAGEAASESLNKTMTAKNLQDVQKADAVVEEAKLTADAAGMDPQMKADYILKARESANKQAAASNPAAQQQAAAGALQQQQLGVQKAAMTLQADTAQHSAELQRLGATQLPSAQETFGQAMGYTGQALMSGKSIQNQSKMADAYAAKSALDPSTTSLRYEEGLTPSWMTPAPDPETIIGAAELEQTVRRGTDVFGQALASQAGSGANPADVAALGGTTTSAPATAASPATTASPAPTQSLLGGPSQSSEGPMLGPSQFPEGPMLGPELPPRAPGMEGVDPDLMSVDELMGTNRPLPNYGETEIPDVNYSDQGPGFDAFGDPLYSDQPIPLGGTGQLGDPLYRRALEQQGFSYASGGMAGATGPEVAVLGEEGPELVLNAKQTAELAQALGGAQPYAMGGVAGAKKKKLPGYAGGGVAGVSKPDQSQFDMEPEELLEYLRTFKDMQGAL